MIVDVYTTWCGWCRVMEKQTYGDPEVSAYLKQNFVMVKVNGESSSKMHWQGKELTEKEFARAVGVTGYPATYFLKPNADMLGGGERFRPQPRIHDLREVHQHALVREGEDPDVRGFAAGRRGVTPPRRRPAALATPSS